MWSSLSQNMFMLGPISALDCIAFCVFLAIQLPLQVGLFETLRCLVPCLPFLREFST